MTMDVAKPLSNSPDLHFLIPIDLFIMNLFMSKHVYFIQDYYIGLI